MGGGNSDPGGPVFTLGLTSSAFVTFGGAAPVTYRFGVGPELKVIGLCPVFFVSASGGWLWSIAADQPARVGGYFSLGALVSSKPNYRPYYEASDSRPFFAGPRTATSGPPRA